MSVSVLCILQARVSSSRLPGKVLMPILGEPILARQIERIRRARLVDALTVATSDEPSDDAIAELCSRLDVACFRGSLDDVLDRFYQAASGATLRAGHVMRLTGDCPLTDPALLDALVELHLEGGFDYSSNVEERTFPDGLDAEIFSHVLLERTWREATAAYDREHVTPYMRRAVPVERRGRLTDRVDRSNLRWTVDYPEDFEFARQVFEALYPGNPGFDADDVHALLHDHPEIAAVNARRVAS
ncbi:MAG: glycosyltransferase family protein [Chloroflexota bacterium]